MTNPSHGLMPSRAHLQPNNARSPSNMQSLHLCNACQPAHQQSTTIYGTINCFALASLHVKTRIHRRLHPRPAKRHSNLTTLAASVPGSSNHRVHAAFAGQLAIKPRKLLHDASAKLARRGNCATVPWASRACLHRACQRRTHLRGSKPSQPHSINNAVCIRQISSKLWN
jgi:hypothetical protein